jgi:hypothetical protein
MFWRVAKNFVELARSTTGSKASISIREAVWYRRGEKLVGPTIA